MARFDISLVRGETLGAVVFALVDPSGAPYDLTGCSARLLIETQPSTDCCSPVPSSTVAELLSTSGSAPRLVISALAGEITIDVTSAQTTAWATGEHTYRLWVTDAGGDVRVAFDGFFTVND